MSDEAKTEDVAKIENERINMGREARAILNSRAGLAAINKVATDAQLDWLNTDPEERERREELYLLTRGVGAFVNSLNAIANDGKMIEDRIAKEQAKKDSNKKGNAA